MLGWALGVFRCLFASFSFFPCCLFSFFGGLGPVALLRCLFAPFFRRAWPRRRFFLFPVQLSPAPLFFFCLLMYSRPRCFCLLMYSGPLIFLPCFWTRDRGAQKDRKHRLLMVMLQPKLSFSRSNPGIRAQLKYAWPDSSSYCTPIFQG